MPGYNTTVTIKPHQGTIPALPKLGEAMSKLAFDMQVPNVPVPRSHEDTDGDGKPHFVQSAMYVSCPGDCY